MYKHHQDSINNILEYFKDDSEIISIILGGSVAKGCAKPESDIDLIIAVTPKKYLELSEKNILAECISEDICTYEDGYFDIKYCDKGYLLTLCEKGSEPARNAFVGAQCLYTKDNEIVDIISKIPIFQKNEKDEKMLSFYSTFILNCNYFWWKGQDDIYLKTRSASDIVFFGYRLLLQENEVLFPSSRGLMGAVSNLKNKPKNIIEISNKFLETLDNEYKEEFQNTLLEFLDYQPPEDYGIVLTRFVDDNELWWYKNRPFIEQW